MALRSAVLCSLAASVSSARLFSAAKPLKADVEFQSTFTSEDVAQLSSVGSNRYW
jgi:hypothetical protein